MSHFPVLVIGDNIDEQLEAYQANNMGDVPERYLEFQEDDESPIDEKTGQRGYWYNPNVKWDWYVIGGRWHGYFKLKKGKKGQLGQPGAFGNQPSNDADMAKKGDIDWTSMKSLHEKHAIDAWNTYIQKHGDKGNQKHAGLILGVKPDDTKESYVERMGSVATFAMVKDGKWYSNGDMGWFGISYNEKSAAAWEREFHQLLEDVPDDTTLTIVDCHI